MGKHLLLVMLRAQFLLLVPIINHTHINDFMKSNIALYNFIKFSLFTVLLKAVYKILWSHRKKKKRSQWKWKCLEKCQRQFFKWWLELSSFDMKKTTFSLENSPLYSFLFLYLTTSIKFDKCKKNSPRGNW